MDTLPSSAAISEMESLSLTQGWQSKKGQLLQENNKYLQCLECVQNLHQLCDGIS